MRTFYSVWFITTFCILGVTWSGCAGPAFTSMEQKISEGGEGAEAGESAHGGTASGGTSGGASTTGGSENGLGGRSSGGTSGGRSSGGSSGTPSTQVAGAGGSEDTDAGQGGQSDGGEVGQGGSTGIGGGGSSGGVSSCVTNGLTIQITPIGGLTVSSLCVTTGAPDAVREPGSCGNVEDMNASASVFLGCVTPKPPVKGTRYCFDGLIGQGGRACDRVGQDYCGSLGQYQVSSHGTSLELSPVFYPEGCAATNMCYQALCFTIP